MPIYTVDNTYDNAGFRADAFNGAFACAWVVARMGGTFDIKVSTNRAPLNGLGAGTGWTTQTLVAGLTKTNVGCFFLPQGWLAVTYDQTVAGVTSPVIAINKTGGADTSAWDAPIAFPDSARVDKMIRAQGTLYRLRQEYLKDAGNVDQSYVGLLARMEGVTGQYWTTEYWVLPPNHFFPASNLNDFWLCRTRGITGFWDGVTMNIMFVSDAAASFNIHTRIAKTLDPHDWSVTKYGQWAAGVLSFATTKAPVSAGGLQARVDGTALNANATITNVTYSYFDQAAPGTILTTTAPGPFTLNAALGESVSIDSTVGRTVTAVTAAFVAGPASGTFVFEALPNSRYRTDEAGRNTFYTDTPVGSTLTQSNMVYMLGEDDNTGKGSILLGRGGWRTLETISTTLGYWGHTVYRKSAGTPAVVRTQCDIVYLDNIVSVLYYKIGFEDGPPFQMSTRDGGATWQFT